jgi:iron complex outermembrane receptor protein
LRYLHSDALDIILSLDALQDKRDPRTYVLVLDGVGHDAAPGPREVSHNEEEYGNRENYGGALTIDYRLLNKYKFKSISAYRQNKYSSLTDMDGAPLDVMKSKDEEDDYHFTQEFRLVSPSFRNFNFVGGMFYFYQKARKNLRVIGGPDFGVPDFSVSGDGPVTTNSVAGYFNSNLRINDKIAFNAGLRYTYEYKEINFSQKSLPAPIFTIDLDDYRDTYSEGVLSPKIGINYEFNNRLMFYGSIARGYKSGGWNSVFVSSTDYLKFKPEFATSYEIGLKSASLNNRLVINAAVFLGKFSDYQVNYWQQTETGVINQVFQNAGKVTSKGIEIDLSTIPLKNLSLIARLAYTDIKYDEFKNGGGEGIDYDGNRVEIAPEFEYSLGIEYRYPIIQLGTFILRGDYVHKDDFFTDPSNEPEYIVPGYDLINGRIGYLSAGENWEIYLWGKNLTDKLYLLEKHFLPTGDLFGWYAIPRTYGIQVRYSIFK